MKFFQDLLANPDGSYSTKRVAGWICLLVSIMLAFLGIFKNGVNEVILLTVFGGFMGGFLGSFGISTLDARYYWQYMSKKIPDDIEPQPVMQDPLMPPTQGDNNRTHIIDNSMSIKPTINF